MEDFNNQLYSALADLCDNEPLSIIRNTVGRNGLEVWRKLNYRYDPQTATRTKDSYSQIVYTNPVPLEKLSNAIENWETLYRQHVDAGKGTINEPLLCEALIKLCPKDLNEQIKFQIDQLVDGEGSPSLDKMKAKIDNYLRVKIPVGGEKSGPTPMDLDSLAKRKEELQNQIFALQNKNKPGKGYGGGKQGGKGHKGGKGGQYSYAPYSYNKGKGKGKQNKGNSKGGGKAGDKGGKGSGKDGKGSTGKGSSGYFRGNCGYCHKWGHRSADCRKRMRDQGGINNIELQEDWDWEESPDFDDFGVPIWETEHLMTYQDESWDGPTDGAQDLSQSGEPGAEPASKTIESLEAPQLGQEDQEALLALQAEFDALGGLNSLEIPELDFEPALTRRQRSKLRRMRFAPKWGCTCPCADDGEDLGVRSSHGDVGTFGSFLPPACGKGHSPMEEQSGSVYFPPCAVQLEPEVHEVLEPVKPTLSQPEHRPKPKSKSKAKSKSRANPKLKHDRVWKLKSRPVQEELHGAGSESCDLGVRSSPGDVGTSGSYDKVPVPVVGSYSSQDERISNQLAIMEKLDKEMRILNEQLKQAYQELKSQADPQLNILQSSDEPEPRANPKPNILPVSESMPELTSSEESELELEQCESDGAISSDDDGLLLSLSQAKPNPFMSISEVHSLIGEFKPVSSFVHAECVGAVSGAALGSRSSHGDVDPPGTEPDAVLTTSAGQHAEEGLTINIMGEDNIIQNFPMTIDELESKWEVIWVTADSGAAVSMFKEEQAQDYPIQPTAESKAGICYTAANGGKVPEKGKRVPLLKSEGGRMGMIPFKVGKINKALCSVKDLCSRGNRVVFDDDGSFIFNKRTGETTKIYEVGRTYAFPVQVVPRSIAVKLAAARKSSTANSKLNQLQQDGAIANMPFQGQASKL